MSNRLILVLVEGKSDSNALYHPLNNVFNSLYNGCYYVDFVWLFGHKANENGGDVTSEKTNTRSLFLENYINTFLIDTFFKTTKHFWKPSDLAGIIQFNDTDGAFIPDKLVHENQDCLKIRYSESCIETRNRIGTIERNRRKSTNMIYLSGKKSFTVQGRKSITVPYSYHYFSSCIDSVLYGKYNSAENEKTTDSDDLFTKCAKGYSLEDAFGQKGELADYTTQDMSYEESWSYIQDGTNSLSRMTNINTLFDRIYAGYFD